MVIPGSRFNFKEERHMWNFPFFYFKTVIQQLYIAECGWGSQLVFRGQLILYVQQMLGVRSMQIIPIRPK